MDKKADIDQLFESVQNCIKSRDLATLKEKCLCASVFEDLIRSEEYASVFSEEKITGLFRELLDVAPSKDWKDLYCRLIEENSDSPSSYFIEAYTESMLDADAAYFHSAPISLGYPRWYGSKLQIPIAINNSALVEAADVLLNLSVCYQDPSKKEREIQAEFDSETSSIIVDMKDYFSVQTVPAQIVDGLIQTQRMRLWSNGTHYINVKHNGRNIDNAIVISSNGCEETKLTVQKLYSRLDLIYKPYSYAISIDQNGIIWQNIRECKGWFKIQVRTVEASESAEETSGEHAFPRGILYCATSELQHHKVELKWEHQLVQSFEDKNSDEEINKKIARLEKELEQTLSNKNGLRIHYPQSAPSDPRLDEKLDEYFSNVCKSSARVLCVGNANAILILNKYNNGTKKTIAFDFGLPGYRNEDQLKNSTDCKKTSLLNQFGDEKMSKWNPDLVIISHWHADHYLGMFSLDRKFYIGKNRGFVIAQDYNIGENGIKKDNYAKKLVAFLVKNQRILLVHVDKDQSVEIYNKNGCSLFFSNFPNDPETYYNNVSLLLRINRTLFPADCAVERWPTAFYSRGRIDRMLIPHHGSKNGNQCRDRIDGGIAAYVCACSLLTGWDHPDSEVMDYYRKKFDSVYRTDGEHQDDRIEDNFRFDL